MSKRTKRIIGTILVICILAGVIIYGIKSANSRKLNFHSSDQIINYLKTVRPDHLAFTCSENLYPMLRENDFYEFSRLLVWAQADHKQAKISHNDSLRTIILKDLVYTNIPCEEALSRESLNRTVKAFAAKKISEFNLLCREDFYERITMEHLLEKATAKHGIESYTAEYSIYPGILEVTDIKYFEQPYTTVKDAESFAAAIQTYSAEGIDDFYLIPEPVFFDKITSKPKEMKDVIKKAGISSYEEHIDKDRCLIHFSDVIYEK